MLITQDDLRALAYRVRTPRDFPLVRAAIREDNYGTEWCLTDILRLEEEANGVLKDIVCGIAKGRSDPERRINVSVELRSVDGSPWSFTKVRPTGQAPANMTDWKGVEHHLPQQWEPQEYKYPASFTANLADDNYRNSAVWLLYNYGWRAAQGGHDRRRYTDKRSKSGDRWQLVEAAFVRLHPELSPPGMVHGTMIVDDSATVTDAATLTARRKPGRPRKGRREQSVVVESASGR